MTEKQLIKMTWVLIFALLICIIAIKLIPREKRSPNEPKQGLKFETSDSIPLMMYTYPSGATGSLERDFETGQKGTLIKN